MFSNSCVFVGCTILCAVLGIVYQISFSNMLTNTRREAGPLTTSSLPVCDPPLSGTAGYRLNPNGDGSVINGNVTDPTTGVSTVERCCAAPPYVTNRCGFDAYNVPVTSTPSGCPCNSPISFNNSFANFTVPVRSKNYLDILDCFSAISDPVQCVSTSTCIGASLSYFPDNRTIPGVWQYIGHIYTTKEPISLPRSCLDIITIDHSRCTGLYFESCAPIPLPGRKSVISTTGSVLGCRDPVPLADGESIPPVTEVRRVYSAYLNSSGHWKVPPVPVNPDNPSQTIGVAVFDTGIDYNHPDLKTHVQLGIDCSVNGGTGADDVGHGTHVSGILSASNGPEGWLPPRFPPNATLCHPPSPGDYGIVGVAPGTQLYSVKVNIPGTSTISVANFNCGLNWLLGNAKRLNIKVVSASLFLGFDFDDFNCGYNQVPTQFTLTHQLICKVINETGITFVFAAGDSFSSFNFVVPQTYHEVLTVTWMTDYDGRPGGLAGFQGCQNTCNGGTVSDMDDDYSSITAMDDTGGTHRAHMVAAPGSCINSTWWISGAPEPQYAICSGSSYMCDPIPTSSPEMIQRIVSRSQYYTQPLSPIPSYDPNDAATFNVAPFSFGFYVGFMPEPLYRPPMI